MPEVSKESIMAFMSKFSERYDAVPYGFLIHFINAKCVDCSVEESWADFEIVMPAEGINPIKSMHGGYLAAIADNLMCGTALAFINDRSYTVTTIDLHLDTIKAMYPGDKIKMRCSIEHLGKRTSLVTCRFFRDGVLCAIASENLTRLALGDKVSFIEDYESLRQVK